MERGANAGVEVLGDLRVVADGRLLGSRDLGGRKPKQVLEMLLVHRGQPVSKERIIDLLWAQRPPRNPMRTLEAYVSVLRGRLASAGPAARGLVRSGPGVYRAGLEGIQFDLALFDELVSQAAGLAPAQRLAHRERALALVRGDLLADEPYAEWVLALRDLYAERYIHTLLDAAEDCLVLDRPRDAVRYAEQVLVRQPHRERAHRLLVAARYASGEQDLAVQAYERCVRVLDEQLGVRPLPETEQVYLAVLRHHPVGRAEDLHTLSVSPSVPAPGLPAWPAPQTRFARNGAVSIAYQVIGERRPESVDVVFAHGWFSHMEVGWEEPRYAAFLHRLANGRRLVLFDRRGMGMSDPAPASVGLAERATDMLAVMDAAGSDRAVVFGSCGAGPQAIWLAATAPERVAGLVLFGTYARLIAGADYPDGWTPQFFGQYLAGLEQGWATGRGIARSVPSAGRDEALMEWLSRLLRLSVSPAEARAILEFGASVDVRDMLGRTRSPALVLHRKRDQWVDPANGRYLARHIPDARLVELDGADHWPWFGDADAVLRPVEEFLDGRARRPEDFPRVTAPR